MSVDVDREAGRYQEVAPIRLRQLNRAYQGVHIAAALLQRCELDALDRGLIGAAEERQVAAALRCQQRLDLIPQFGGK